MALGTPTSTSHIIYGTGSSPQLGFRFPDEPDYPYFEDFVPAASARRVKYKDAGQAMSGTLYAQDQDGSNTSVDGSIFLYLLFEAGGVTQSVNVGYFSPIPAAAGGRAPSFVSTFPWSISNATWTSKIASLAQAEASLGGGPFSQLRVQAVQISGGPGAWLWYSDIVVGSDYSFLAFPDGHDLAEDAGELYLQNKLNPAGIDLSEEMVAPFLDTPYNLLYRPIRIFDLAASPKRPYQEFR